MHGSLGSMTPSQRAALGDVLRIAHAGQAMVSVSCKDKLNVTIVKTVRRLDDPDVNSLLSGIADATRGSVDHGEESADSDEWIVRSRDMDVTLRSTRTLG